MGRSKYSYMGSKVHLQMDDKLADAYNRAIDAWFEAQRDFEKTHGRKVTAEEIMSGVIQIRATKEEADAYNKVAEFMNKMFANGLELTQDDCPEQKLIKIS